MGLAPGAALTGLCLITFQTRSRDTSRQLQQDARMANRRYIPPARGIHQKIHGPTSPPASPAALLSEHDFAAIRIGDTVEIRFKPVTPFTDICRGVELPASGQAALRFETTVPAGKGSAATIRRIGFEVLYHSFAEVSPTSPICNWCGYRVASNSLMYRFYSVDSRACSYNA